MRASRATIRPSRYPTSEHWYVSCTRHSHTCGISCNIRVPTSLPPPGRTNYDRSEQIILHLFPGCASRGKRVDVADDQNASRERVSQFRSKGLAPKEQVRPPFNRDWYTPLNQLTPLFPATSQKGSFLPVPTRLGRAANLPQVHLPRRHPGLPHLPRGA